MEKPAVTPMYSSLPFELIDADTYAIRIVQQGLLNSRVPTSPLQYIPLDRYRQKASDKTLSDEARVKVRQLELSADKMELLAKELREGRPHHRIVSPLFRDSPGFTRPAPPQGCAETLAESLLSDARAAIAELNAIIPSLPAHKRERAARALESLDQCHEQLLAGRE